AAIFGVSDRYINVGDAEKKAYYGPLAGQMENGGREAMLHDLLAIDLEGWHPRESIPRTVAFRNTVILNLEAFDSWLLGVLEEGVLPGPRFENVPRAVRPGDADEGRIKGMYSRIRTSEPSLRDESDTMLGRKM